MAQTTPDRPDLLYLSTLISAWLCQENIDSLKDTPYYRHEFKQATNTYADKLDAIIRNDLKLVFGEDDEVLFALIDYKKSFINQVASLSPDHYGPIAEIIKRFVLDPDSMMKVLGMSYK